MKIAYRPLLNFVSVPTAIDKECCFRHVRAITHPATEFERAFVELLSGWLRYADAHYGAYASGIGEDYILGPAWAAIGGSLLTLLNGDLGRLDAGTLDGLLRSTLTAEEFDGDNT